MSSAPDTAPKPDGWSMEDAGCRSEHTTVESARGSYTTRLRLEARIVSKSRYEPRYLRANPRKRVVYEPRALSSAGPGPGAAAARPFDVRPPTACAVGEAGTAHSSGAGVWGPAPCNSPNQPKPKVGLLAAFCLV